MNAIDPEFSQAVILDHNEHPRHFGVPDAYTARAEAYNPLCGDRYTLYLSVENGVVSAVSFDGHGCAVSKASHSMMATAVLGLGVQDIDALTSSFREALSQADFPNPDELGELAALVVVRNAPTRIRCALLGWDALERALRSRF